MFFAGRSIGKLLLRLQMTAVELTGSGLIAGLIINFQGRILRVQSSNRFTRKQAVRLRYRPLNDTNAFIPTWLLSRRRCIIREPHSCNSINQVSSWRIRSTILRTCRLATVNAKQQ